MKKHTNDDDRFRFRVWNDESKCYESFPWHIRAHNSHLEVEGEHLSLEQCTGQRDRNGRLIFEGDVLKSGFVTPPLPVSFVDGAFVYTYGNIGNFQLRQEVIGFCEIVGTIHDPEYKDQFREATKMVGTSMSPATEEEEE